MSIFGMFRHAGYEVSGLFMKHLASKGYVPVVLKSEVSTHTVSDTTTYADGISVALPAKMLKANRSLVFTVGGTLTGTNSTKKAILYIDDGVIGDITIVATAVGNWMAQWVVMEYTDYAHQLVHGFCIAGTNSGATPFYGVDTATDTTNLALAKTIKTRIYTAHASDTMTQTWGVVELLPYA